MYMYVYIYVFYTQEHWIVALYRCAFVYIYTMALTLRLYINTLGH
jgi:hypothetical protein